MRVNLPPVTLGLLLVNVTIFLLQQLFGPQLVELLALWPPGPLFGPWQLVTYSFLHEGTLHIFLNMFALFMFGTPLERLWGSPRFLTFYFVSVLAAGLTQYTVASLDHLQAPTLGASGGVFGVLLAFAVYFPRQRIVLLFPPIPMPAWAFVTVYGLIELFQGVGGFEPGVAHFAHLGGMLGAAAMILVWRAMDSTAARR